VWTERTFKGVIKEKRIEAWDHPEYKTKNASRQEEVHRIDPQNYLGRMDKKTHGSKQGNGAKRVPLKKARATSKGGPLKILVR